MSKKTDYEGLGRIMNRTEFAAICGKSTNWVRDMMLQGMPCQDAGKQGVANKYNSAECIDWLIDNAKRKATAKFTTETQGETLDFQVEKARLTKAQADKAELELSLATQEVLERESVLKSWEYIMSAIKQKLLGFGYSLSGEVAFLDNRMECKKVIDGAIRAILDELSTTNPVDGSREEPDSEYLESADTAS